MAHVFVSYSRADRPYVDKLVEHLRAAGIPTWIDRDNIASGDRWVRIIRDHVDSCAALVVIMTPAAEEFEWVGVEVERARSRGKPILPLLVAGDVFFSLGTVHYDDVRGRRMPPPAFVDRLRFHVDGPDVRFNRVGSADGTQDGHRGRVHCVAWSPDGRTVATGGEDGVARVWDSGDGALVHELVGHEAAISCLAYSPGDSTTPPGMQLATASEDRTVRIWQV